MSIRFTQTMTVLLFSLSCALSFAQETISPQATAFASDQIQFNWTTALSGITEQKIHRSLTADFASFASIKMTPSARTYLDVGLTKGTTYYYRIRIVSDTGRAYRSRAVQTATLAGGPVNNLIVFGDSYTRPRPYTWSQHLLNARLVGAVSNNAVSGATASCAITTPPCFLKQVNKRFAGTINDGDAVVVYFGYNDVDNFPDLTRSKADYIKAVDRLIALGATQPGRRLFLTLIHDWGRNPAQRQAGTSAGMRSRVLDWNNFVLSTAASRPGIQTIAVYHLFEKVFARPGDYGFTNITTAEGLPNKITSLFFDSNHFGSQGFKLVSDAMASALGLR